MNLEPEVFSPARFPVVPKLSRDMKVRPDEAKTLEDLKLWAAEHDGRIYAWWDEQHDWNKSVQDCIRKLESECGTLAARVQTLEDRKIGGALIERVGNIEAGQKQLFIFYNRLMYGVIGVLLAVIGALGWRAFFGG